MVCLLVVEKVLALSQEFLLNLSKDPYQTYHVFGGLKNSSDE